MTTLSFTQEFFICVVDEKGKVPFLKQTEVWVGLVVSGILELETGSYIKTDEKEKYIQVKPLDAEKNHLQPLYDVIIKKPMKATMIAEKYISSTKLFMQLFNAIGKSLSDVGCAEKTVNQSFFGEKVAFIPKSDYADTIIEKIRAELLNSGDICDDTIILCALLDKAGLIRNYFSKVESNKLKVRLKEIRSSDEYKKIRKVLNHLDSSFIAILIVTGII
jgi:hypothetical protein